MRYRRALTAGATYFFTVVTAQRRPLLASAEAVEILRKAFSTVRTQRPFTLDAMVVLPDHLHCVWTLPPDDADFAMRWRLIMTWFTKHCDPTLRGDVDPARARKQEQAIWQHRYWEHRIRDDIDYARHVDYIHYNPVKHRLVSAPIDWPYSSFRRFVKARAYDADWGQEAEEYEGIGSE